MSNHRQPSRRTVLSTLGSITATVVTGTATAGAADTDDADARDATDPRHGSTGATRYTAVVDRIVDGEHVVLLLEADGELVDQHVAPRTAFDDVQESDIMTVVIKDGELLTAQHLPKRPGESMPEHRNRRTARDLATEEP